MATPAFKFGENWQQFSPLIDDERIKVATDSILDLTGLASLTGLTFLDIGSGSGLSSLAARRLGAQVHSIDIDPDSVACTLSLSERFFPNDGHWTVERGSVLDQDFLARLGKFDIVYSWGVLHHTGDMARAIRNAASLVADNGLFIFALYHRTPFCGAWRVEKRWYAQASPAGQRRARAIYTSLRRAFHWLRHQTFADYKSSYASRTRGMSFEHDLHDWLGGYPYESAAAAEIRPFMRGIGFEEVRAKIVQPRAAGLFGTGNDEYAYRRCR